MANLRRESTCPIFINNTALLSNKIIKNGDILKIGPKTFKWITNLETPSIIEPKSTNVKRFVRTLKGQRRGSTENIQKICRRSLRHSTTGCVSTWEETNEDLKMKQLPIFNNAKKVSRHSLRNSTGHFSTWEETDSSFSTSKNCVKIKQITISESKPSNLVINEECLKSSKKTPQIKSKSNSIKKIPSKIPKVFLGTQRKDTAEKAAPVKASNPCMTVEDKSPLGVGQAKKLFRNVDSSAKFSTSTFDVKPHSSSVSTTEMSPDKFQMKLSLTKLTGNMSLDKPEPYMFNRKSPRISLVKLNTALTSGNETNCLEKSKLGSSFQETPKKMAEDITPLSAKRSLVKESSTPTLNETVSLSVSTNVKTPDTSLNKPLLTPNIKAIKSTNKRNASLEKSLDNKMLAKKRKIANVIGSEASISLHNISNPKESTVILSPKAKLRSSSHDITDLASDIPQKTATYCMNVSGIDKLANTPKDLRNTSITSGTRKSLRNTSLSVEHAALFDSPGKLVKNRGMSYSTPKSKSNSDWSVVDFTVETPKNITSNAKDKSLKFVSETPDYNLSRDQTNAFIHQTFDKTARRSKTPKQNNVINETFDVSARRNSKTPKQNFIVSNIFNDSRSMNRSLRSASEEISVDDRNFDMSPEQRSKINQQILTVSLGTPIKLTANDSMKRFSTNLKGIKRLHKSPVNDLTNVAGVKQLLSTPAAPQKSPKNELSDLRGVKQLLEPLQTHKSPRNDLTNIPSIKALLRTPGRRQKEIETKNDLTNVAGVKHLLKTPGRKQKVIEPENDLTNVAGVKYLFKSPERKRKETEPKNDLRSVSGIKTLLRSQKEPENDLTNVTGVKYLLRSPMKKEKEPENDLTNVFGVKKLLRSPRRKQNEPKNDLSDLRGVKRLMEPTKEPRNDLSDVDGVAEIMRSPELRSRTPIHSQTINPTNTDSNKQNSELKISQESRNISFKNNASMDDMFDKLIGTNDSVCELDLSPHRHALKTYERKGKSMTPVKSSYIDNTIKSRNSLRFIEQDTKVVDKWLEEHKKYQDTLMACMVHIETDVIEQTSVKEEPKSITRNRNRRVKTEDIDPESIGQALPVTRKRNLRGKKEDKDPEAPQQDKSRAKTPKRNLRSKKAGDIDSETIKEAPLQDEPKSVTETETIKEAPLQDEPKPVTNKRNLRVKKIETKVKETIDELLTEVKPKRRGRPKAVDTKVTRSKQDHDITEEIDEPIVKKLRTRKNDVTPVETESSDVKEVVVKKNTRTMRNAAKPAVLNDTVEILEHSNVPQLDFESLGVKPKVGRKRKVKDLDTQNVWFNVPEESPVKEAKRNTKKTKKESPTLVRRSGRNKK